MSEPTSAKILDWAVVRNTHVLLTSGSHTDRYFDQNVLTTSTDLQDQVARALRNLLLRFEKETGSKIKAIVGSLYEGGTWSSLIRQQIIQVDPTREINTALTRWVGYRFSFVKDVESGHDDRDKVRGREVAIMNDVISTGASVGPIRRAVEEAGGNPKVILSLCDRRAAEVDPGDLPVLSLVKVDWPMWKPEECPFCVRPLVVPHQGREH